MTGYFAVPAALLPDVRVREVKTQSYWTVDAMASPVLEVGTCFHDGTQLRLARMYYTDFIYGPTARVDWPVEFREWAKAAMAHARRVLKKLPSGDRIGPATLEWALSGGQLNNGAGK